MKKDTFTFRLDKKDKEIIEALSDRLHRNQSDAVRWVLREAAAALAAEEGNSAASEPSHA